VFVEAWHPFEHRGHLEQYQAVKRVAMGVAQYGTCCTEVLHHDHGERRVHAVHVPLSQRLSGALCVVHPTGDGAGDARLERIATLVSLRLGGLLELDVERRKAQQFERWFRVSDRQIRALDLERQKFAALVSSFVGGAFVANREGVISWQSRPLLEVGGRGGATSWVGRSCHEFCGALRGDGRGCDECLIHRVLEARQPAARDIAYLDDGEERTLRVVAAPINDPSGVAQQVVVTFQVVPPASRSLAA
jgi:hypothetical protein